MKHKELTKLRLVNDWGHLYYVPYSTKKNQYTRGYTYQDSLDIPKTVLLQWPDGTEERKRLKMRRYHVTVSDHGKDYPVAGEYPVVVGDLHGVKVEVTLDKLRGVYL